MQPVDLSTYPNTAGWFIKHNPENQLYELRSHKGGRLAGAYTTRNAAELALAKYLDRVTAAANKHKKVNKSTETLTLSQSMASPEVLNG